MPGVDDFIQPVVDSVTHRPDDTVETTRRPAMWTLAHSGYSGSGRLDLWGYCGEGEALRAGGELALECGLVEDPHAVDLFEVGN